MSFKRLLVIVSIVPSTLLNRDRVFAEFGIAEKLAV
jgi:hypothetical protein